MDIDKFLNRHNLRIARENAGFDTKRATKRAAQSNKDLVGLWESGEATPTWKQVEKLAKAYGVSTLLMFSKDSLTRRKEIADFRSRATDFDDTDLNQLVNLVVARQRWLSRRLKESGNLKNDLQGSGKKLRSPQALAEYMSESLGISAEGIKAIPGYSTDAKKSTLKYLIEAAEKQGIFVGKTLSHHKIEVKQMRGLFISNEYCPFIIINRKDAVSAQIFTFIHELAHFFRNTDGISNTVELRDINDKNLDLEEVFCNQVAAEFLLPDYIFTKKQNTISDIVAVADDYKVSQIFVFYRMKTLGLINQAELVETEKFILDETRRNIEEKDARKSTGGNHTNNMKDSNGSLFNRFIATAYFENRIGYVEAAKLLKFSPENV